MYNFDVDMSNPDALLYIEYGSYFGGACEIMLLKQDARTAVCYINGYNGWKMGEDEAVTFPTQELKRIEQMVSPIRSWKEEYKSEYDILDGHGWTVRSNFGEKIERKGYMAYPDDYSSVMHGILDCIESIRAYGDGEAKNIPLLSPDAVGSHFVVGKKKQTE